MPGVIALTRIVALLCGALVRSLPGRGARGRAGISRASIAPPTRIPYPVDPSQTPRGTPVATSAIPRRSCGAPWRPTPRNASISAASAVVLTRAEQVTWPDGSLGCPEPGRSYSQALIAGFRRGRHDQRRRTAVSPRRHARLLRQIAQPAPVQELSNSASSGSPGAPQESPWLRVIDRSQPCNSRFAEFPRKLPMKCGARGTRPPTDIPRISRSRERHRSVSLLPAYLRPGQDQRLLFTYRPRSADGSLMAPGPVFIHAEHCEAYSGAGFPDGLRSLPLAFEARASGSRVIALERTAGHTGNADRADVRRPGRSSGCTCATPRPVASSRASIARRDTPGRRRLQAFLRFAAAFFAGAAVSLAGLRAAAFFAAGAAFLPAFAATAGAAGDFASARPADFLAALAVAAGCAPSAGARRCGRRRRAFLAAETAAPRWRGGQQLAAESRASRLSDPCPSECARCACRR